MPHCGYDDSEVEIVYHEMSQIIDKERKLGHIVIIGGDWNAEVASASVQDYANPAGHYGNQIGNSRGAWLQSWAGLKRLVITNTKFKKR
eukprot:2183212-Karenia_brevis.AAC.1